MVPFYLGVHTTKSAVGSHFDFAARKANGKIKKRLGIQERNWVIEGASQVLYNIPGPHLQFSFSLLLTLEGYRNTVVNRKLKNGNSSESQLALVKRLCAEVHAVGTRGWLCSQSLW